MSNLQRTRFDVKITEVNPESESDEILRECLGKFESFVLIGFSMEGEVDCAHVCEDKAEVVILTRLLQKMVDDELAEDFL